MAIMFKVLCAVSLFVIHVECINFNLTVIHINDFHARFDQTNPNGNPCNDDETCIGGFSRLYKQIQTMLQWNPKSILLNAGDNFQGTLYYTVGKWNITRQFLNQLPFDATTIGNHEFDDGIDGLIPFIKSLNFPVVLANVDDHEEPNFQDLCNKSTVIYRDGKKIGIIGVIYSTVNQSSRTGNLNFFPESASVNEEADRLVQEEGVFTNIVLSHAGYDVDQIMAANATDSIGLIVGGHSHVFLYTGNNPPGPDKVEGPYPTIVKSKRSGNKVLIVQASAFCKYVGNLTVTYDTKGHVVDYSGSPIYLEHAKPQDSNINSQVDYWKKKVVEFGSRKIGETLVTLEGANNTCRASECTMGNFITDAMVYAHANRAGRYSSWTDASIAITNSGGIRDSIKRGEITYGDLLRVQPFENTIDVGELKGEHIREMLEFSVTPAWPSWRPYYYFKLLQVSGMTLTFNVKNPVGKRLVSAKIRCQKCKIPIYEELRANETYKVIMPAFLRLGGDGFSMISQNIQNVRIGEMDVEVIEKYLKRHSPVFEETEERIVIRGQSISDRTKEA